MFLEFARISRAYLSLSPELVMPCQTFSSRLATLSTFHVQTTSHLRHPSQLGLTFVSDPEQVAAEVVCVTHPGGVVAAPCGTSEEDSFISGYSGIPLPRSIHRRVATGGPYLAGKVRSATSKSFDAMDGQIFIATKIFIATSSHFVASLAETPFGASMTRYACEGDS